ncbi:cation:proton antiporter domain-containing protein [Halobellus sp. GM3]|uniref:cation:proton antiporter domain-containing protein n=1 Tax=Halobellus sp. GM3 TaxID=3458410 RepID=UPI00403DB383
MASSLLPVIATILVSGIGVQLLARRVRVPSVVFYLALGILLGPFGLGVVTVDTFGDGLETIVGLSVAIIVFDGAFALRIDRLREASTASLRLVTIGAAVTFLGTAAAVHALERVGWPMAFVIGALLVATGPTVVTPILEVVRVREHVAAALETEGILNDVTAAIAAVVIFETLLLDGLGATAAVLAFLERFGVGVAAGLLATVLIYALLEYGVTRERGPQAARFLVLSAAVGSFALAEAAAAEAGIAAAATAGIALGNVDLPHREAIEEFARDATLIVLAFVFVSLAALIDVGAIVRLGVSGILLVVVVMFVLRPLAVGIATAGIERFTRSERLFLAAIGPRGIVPASVATLFAIELATRGETAAAQTLLGTVFVVIAATDAVEAGLARQTGEILGVTPMRTIIVGGGRVGLALATRLEHRGEFVVLVEDDPARIEAALDRGITVHEGDGTESDALREAGIEDAKRVVAATADDDDNVLICQTARAKFGIEDLYAQVNDPQNADVFESLSVTAVDGPTATAFALDNEIGRPELANWMSDPGSAHAVEEVRVTDDALVDTSIRDLNERIPGGCLIAEIGRGEAAHVPDPDETLSYGDHVTFIGDAAAVETAVKRFHPHE